MWLLWKDARKRPEPLRILPDVGQETPLLLLLLGLDTVEFLVHLGIRERLIV